MSLKTPIAFCIFNRPELTREVFETIRFARPSRLLVIGDGPRFDRPEEEALVRETRKVIEQVDWPCEVQTNFSDVNLGCKVRMSTGLTWAFEQSEELIILEDDCLPDPSFFNFCESLLDYYRKDERVMMVSGDNFQPNQIENKPSGRASYYFSRWPHIWGWASWRRAWKHFDVNIESWPSTKSKGELENRFGSTEEYNFWSAQFDRVHAGEIDTWDFSWAYAVWKQNGLTILPNVNLVSNLGFGTDATHTLDPLSKLANLPVGKINQLTHPEKIEPNVLADQYTWHNILAPPPEPKQPQPKKWHRRILQSIKSR